MPLDEIIALDEENKNVGREEEYIAGMELLELSIGIVIQDELDA